MSTSPSSAPRRRAPAPVSSAPSPRASSSPPSASACGPKDWGAPIPAAPRRSRRRSPGSSRPTRWAPCFTSRRSTPRAWKRPRPLPRAIDKWPTGRTDRSAATPAGPPMTAAFSRDRYLPYVDGLRAVSILGVLGFHVGLPGFPGGFVGVAIFFVISGYLIIGQIAGGLAAGRFGIGDFFARRVLRILPPML